MNRWCGTLKACPTSQRGQALLVAVLVLFAVAALAALFTAIVGSQVAQVGRHSDLVELRSVAEAGLNYANEQLTYSIPGADWRPPSQPGRPLQPNRFRCGRGQFTLSVDYGPEPSQGVQSRFIRVLSTATFPGNPFLRHTVLALKPVLLTDYARFITDRFATGQPAVLGVPGLELGGQARQDHPYVFTISGPIRSNTDTIWYGTARVDLFTSDAVAEGWTRWRDLGRDLGLPGVLRDDRIEIAGRLRPADLSSESREKLRVYIHDDDNLADDLPRADNLFYPTAQLELDDCFNGFPDWTGDTAIPNSWRLLAQLPDYMRLLYPPDWGEPPYLAVPRVAPPDIEAGDPDLQINRYLALTRDSGTWLQVLPNGNTIVHTPGAFGWGWTRFGGIYVDNFRDIQYQHDLEKLRRNWVGSVGAHQGGTPKGDARSGAAGPLAGPADWWDRTGRYYAPPGVEIILHGDEGCPYLEIIRDDANGSADDPYYWRDPSGNPITVSSGEFTYAAQAGECSPSALLLSVNGPRALFPFPPNGVVYAEGNVRIRGIMPPRMGAVTGYRDGPQNRRFDLTVVSGGTIYIEGDLLGPRSASLPVPGAAPGNIIDTLEEDMAYGSRIALLARDHVCVNTTALNPRPRKMFEPETVERPGSPGTYDTYWHNDRYPIYPSDDFPRFDLLQGPRDSDLNSVDGAQLWNPDEPYPTDPDYLDFLYQNVRLDSWHRRNDELIMEGVNDLRLMLGHSGWYIDPATGKPALPPAPETGSDEPAVTVGLSISPFDPETFTTYPWQHASDFYTFLRPDNPNLDPASYDQSGHWYLLNDPDDYLDDDYLEFLPRGTITSEYQDIRVHDTRTAGAVTYLTGRDLLRLESWVSPVRHYDEDGQVDGWQVYPQDLGYLVGPLAIAPPRAAEPLPVRIEALVYAQNGSWSIIPGPWFNEDPSDTDRTQDHPGYHEPLNIRITFYGAITENMPAPIGDVADWTSKWAGPENATGPFISYEYDPLLRWSPVWGGTYLRFRSFPLTPDLLVWGERVSGQAAA